MTIRIGKEVEEKMGVGMKSKAIPQHLLQLHCKSPGMSSQRFPLPSSERDRRGRSQGAKEVFFQILNKSNAFTLITTF